jgi:hypothetical protein
MVGARERLSKHVPGAMGTRTRIQVLLRNGVFYVVRVKEL